MTIMTVDWLAREALLILQNNLVASLLFDRRYESDFTGTEARGDTIRLRRRDRGNAQEFTGTINARGLEESTINLVLEKHFDASFEITSKELTLELDDFSSQVLEPQVVSIAELVDTFAVSKFKDLPNIANVDGTDLPLAAPTAIIDLANARKVNNETKVPMAGRVAVWDPTLEAAMLGIDAFVTADKKGDTGTALREASLGRVLGYDHFMSQNVDGETALVIPAVADQIGAINAMAGFPVGTLALAVDGFTVSLTPAAPAGSNVTIGNFKYTVAVDFDTDMGGAGTLTILEGLKEPVADGDAVTLFGLAAGDNYFRRGALFHPRAFALASVPLVIPPGATGSSISDQGISIRVIQDYDSTTKKAIISLDVLVGARVVDGSLGAQFVTDA